MVTEEGGWEKKVDKTLMWEQSEADTIAVKKTLQLKKRLTAIGQNYFTFECDVQKMNQK